MLKRLRRAWLQHVLYRSRIPFDCWHQTMNTDEVFSHLDFSEQHRLRKLASLFLHDKTISGADGFDVDLEKRVYIAAHACLLILNLELDYFRGWHEIIVYPGSFVIQREEYDASGVVHETRRTWRGKHGAWPGDSFLVGCSCTGVFTWAGFERYYSRICAQARYVKWCRQWHAAVA